MNIEADGIDYESLARVLDYESDLETLSMDNWLQCRAFSHASSDNFVFSLLINVENFTGTRGVVNSSGDELVSRDVVDKVSDYLRDRYNKRYNEKKSSLPAKGHSLERFQIMQASLIISLGSEIVDEFENPDEEMSNDLDKIGLISDLRKKWLENAKKVAIIAWEKDPYKKEFGDGVGRYLLMKEGVMWNDAITDVCKAGLMARIGKKRESKAQITNSTMSERFMESIVDKSERELFASFFNEMNEHVNVQRSGHRDWHEHSFGMELLFKKLQSWEAQMTASKFIETIRVMPEIILDVKDKLVELMNDYADGAKEAVVYLLQFADQSQKNNEKSESGDFGAMEKHFYWNYLEAKMVTSPQIMVSKPVNVSWRDYLIGKMKKEVLIRDDVGEIICESKMITIPEDGLGDMVQFGMRVDGVFIGPEAVQTILENPAVLDTMLTDLSRLMNWGFPKMKSYINAV